MYFFFFFFFSSRRRHTRWPRDWSSDVCSSDLLISVHDVRIKRMDLGDNVLHRFDPQTRTLEIGEHLPSGQYAFKLAAELAYLEHGPLIDRLVDEGSFTSDDSRTLARLGLANYFAAATVLP